jgi:glycosyltransferase involved in cell wall biosynthesis
VGSLNKKIAIFHDYFGVLGGGEKVVLEMARILNADIITTDTTLLQNLDTKIRVISLGKIIKYPGLKQISAALKFYLCKFSKDYEIFIFSGNWSHYAARTHHPNIWYCHIHIPTFYDLNVNFSSHKNIIHNFIFLLWKYIHLRIDAQSVSNIDYIIANSENIQEKISRYYKRDSVIINPPIDIAKFSFHGYGDFWISVNRLYPEKRIEIQIEAFKKIPQEKLLIVGGVSDDDHSGSYAKSLLDNLPENVKFLGQITEMELINLYATCKGLVCTSVDEPFGMAVIEAMASGKPVVAVDSGGFRETVTVHTGKLEKPDPDRIAGAICEISRSPEQYHDDCIAHAQDFDINKFKEKICNVITVVNRDSKISFVSGNHRK